MSLYDFRAFQRSFLQHEHLPFADVLSEQDVEQAFEDEGIRCTPEPGVVYTPVLTLWAFLSQVLSKKEMRSCVAAVSRVIVLLVTLGREPCADDTGAYCRARARLPVAVIRRLTYQVADASERQLPQAWLWKGRHVHLVDGTTVSMPDTCANQQEYPQSSTQKKGLGFPIARMVVLLSLATAMVTGMALGPYAGKETGETALLRQSLDRLKSGDIVLADSYYCSYFMAALLREHGVDIVARLHHRRKSDFRQGRRLGKGDRVVNWQKPDRPDWMDEQTYRRMPASIRVREVRVRVNQPGFRVESFTVVTTLTDANEHTAADIAELYHKRWLAELDIRAIKVTLGIDVLRCKSPEMVRRELWTALLAYNLIRRTILQSALLHQRSPRQISFTTAMQEINSSFEALPSQLPGVAVVLVAVHLCNLAGHRVGHRPGRVEPRAVKRRSKPHKLLTQPRQQAREELLAGSQK